MHLIWFTAQKKRFAVERYSIIGLEEDSMGCVLVVHFCELKEIQRMHIDESFAIAYDRINGLEPFDTDSLVKVE